MYFCNLNANVAQLVEHQLPKLRVAGSNPVIRSKRKDATNVSLRFFLVLGHRCATIGAELAGYFDVAFRACF